MPRWEAPGGGGEVVTDGGGVAAAVDESLCRVAASWTSAPTPAPSARLPHLAAAPSAPPSRPPLSPPLFVVHGGRRVASKSSFSDSCDCVFLVHFALIRCSSPVRFYAASLYDCVCILYCWSDFPLLTTLIKSFNY
ncbi:hypothetical protein VPH35_127536 [Triticum aestivum]